MTSGGGVEDNKNRSVDHQQQQPPPPPFQGVSNYQAPPQQYQPPPTGYPQPAQPYVAGYAVPGGRPVTDHHRRLPCCGIGIGWLLFILGFFFGAIPWYIGFFCLLFSKNPRERPGYIACTIGAIIATIFIVLGALRGSRVW